MTEEKKEITEQRTEQSPVREVNFTEFSENGEWFDSTGEETIEEYLKRKYPGEKWQKIEKKFNPIEKRKITLSEKGYLWDVFLNFYGRLKPIISGFFSLININDLTELVKQLDKNNHKEPEFMKKFGFKANETRLITYITLDNLANQILARCVIVVNRLTHGEDKESEENIMRLAFSYQNCPLIFQTIIQEDNLELLKQKAQAAINGDAELLKRLQDLPYLNPKYKLNKIDQQTQTQFQTQDKSTQTDLTMEQIKQWEKAEKKKTLYQKYIEKYGKK